MTLALALLGGFQATLAGKPLGAFPTQKVRALLAYLALEADKPQPRGRLRGLFWPDSDDAAALGNLRKDLHRLQQTLAQRDPSLSAGLLSVNRQTIQLDKNFFSTDVAEFEALLRECEAHPHLDVHTCPTCLEALDRAAALYQGELLAGLALQDAPEFEEWLLLRRSSLHNQALAALETLADAHEKRGDDARALLYVTRQLALDPYLEAAQRQRMRLLARSGKASEALRSYEAWRRLLAAEMGVEPAAETTGLYERIQAGDIATLRSPRHNLPLSLTALLGRHEELARMAGLLASASCRLLTLYGAGGVGKTSLALAAAREALERFPDGVFFVSLAAIDKPELVPAVIAQALGVRPFSAQPVLEALKTSLGDKKMLLVLDNFEHLLEAAPAVKELLASCPELKIVVTSRALLEVRGEIELEVPPLAVPDVRHIPGPEALLGYPAVALFCERARAVKPDFSLTDENAATVATICVRLDGLPLAIELVAARVKLMSLGKLLERLVRASGRFALLTGGARDLPPHQRTLQSTIAWSYTLRGRR
jgi:DNA-binding SARP family transcriptional activator